MTLSVTIVPTGTANLASVSAAFRRLGVVPSISTDVREVRDADGVVVPGVGSFGAAMQSLAENGLVHRLRERARNDRPTLGICVGFQVLAAGSAESQGIRGLGVLDAALDRFGSSVSVPQLGWNRVDPNPAARFVPRGWAYFANSYRIPWESGEPIAGWTSSAGDHGGLFVAATERGNVLGCQFHPELSGAFGATVLDAWLTNARRVA